MNAVTLIYGALREVVVSDLIACLRTGDVESFRKWTAASEGRVWR